MSDSSQACIAPNWLKHIMWLYLGSLQRQKLTCTTQNEYQVLTVYLKMAAASLLPVSGERLAFQVSPETAQRWKAVQR